MTILGIFLFLDFFNSIFHPGPIVTLDEQLYDTKLAVEFFLNPEPLMDIALMAFSADQIWILNNRLHVAEQPSNFKISKHILSLLGPQGQLL